MTDITDYHIGVSGRRGGMTPAQEHAFFGEMIAEIRNGATHVHHGACTGLDQFVHFQLSRNWTTWTVVHPPEDTKYSAMSRLLRHVRRTDLEPKVYAARNSDIVDGLMPDGTTHQVRTLLAAPAYPEDDKRSQRSGTWQTVRMAADRGVPVRIVDENGDVYPYIPKSARTKATAAKASVDTSGDA